MSAKPRYLGFNLHLFGRMKNVNDIDQAIADVLLSALKPWGVDVVEVEIPAPLESLEDF